MAHDHFAQLDPSDTSVIDAEHQEYSHQQQSASHGHEQQPGETEDDADLSFNDDPDGRPAKKKMRLPIPVLLGGGFIVFIALFAGYKKIVGHPAHPSSVPSAVASLPADDGSGNGNGGMMAPHGQAGFHQRRRPVRLPDRWRDPDERLHHGGRRRADSGRLRSCARAGALGSDATPLEPGIRLLCSAGIRRKSPTNGRVAPRLAELRRRHGVGNSSHTV